MEAELRMLENGGESGAGGGLSDKVKLFNEQVNQHKQQQAINPFSSSCCSTSNLIKPTFTKDQYGRPPPGSLSEKRGQKANVHVFKEMLELCEIINEYGFKYNADKKVILFGDLFQIYTVISDKLVGMLLRARKHQIVDFEGECLFQRRDDHVPVYLLKPIDDIRKIFKEKIDAAIKASIL